MPQCIVKLTKGDRVGYIIWSTVVDAPVTSAMARDELDRYMRRRQGDLYMKHIHPTRMARVDRHGTSDIHGVTPSEMIEWNRAGPNESELTMEEILDMAFA